MKTSKISSTDVIQITAAEFEKNYVSRQSFDDCAERVKQLERERDRLQHGNDELVTTINGMVEGRNAERAGLKEEIAELKRELEARAAKLVEIDQLSARIAALEAAARWVWCHVDGSTVREGEITHWRPLPNPPEAQS